MKTKLEKALEIVGKFIEEFDNQGEVSYNTRDEAEIFLTEQQDEKLCTCVDGLIICPGCYGEESEFGVCAGCDGSGEVTCGKCGGKGLKIKEPEKMEEQRKLSLIVLQAEMTIEELEVIISEIQRVSEDLGIKLTVKQEEQ